MKILLVIICLFLAVPAFGATCKIDELTGIRADANNRNMQVGNYSLPAGVAVPSQSVTYTTSAQSNAFGAGIHVIRVICDAKAHFVIAANPTATANSSYIPVDTKEYFGVTAGLKIAFYDGTS